MIIDRSSKRCSKCEIIQSRESFGNNRATSDGLAHWCKGCLNASSRRYHAANREKVLIRHRGWLQANAPDRENVAERSRHWRRENPDHARALAKNGKHRRRARTRGGMSGPDLRAWENSQCKACHWCGAQCADGYEIDHRTPLAKGGKHERSNLVIACVPCNRSKAARCPIEFAQSLGKLL